MSKYKNLTMKLLCHIVSKTPFLFSGPFLWMKRIRWVSEDYFKYKNDDLECYEDIKTFSLFDPRLKWKAKAISTLTAISGDETKCLLKWINKQTAFRDISTDVSILKQGSYNVGSFKTGFGKAHFNIDASLGLDSKYVKSCNVYLIMLDNGNYYISTYWFLKDEATAVIREVDISHIKTRSVDYYTCNPFSSKFGHCQISDKLSDIHRLILNNIENIFNEIKVVEKRLFQLLDISIRGNQAVALDIHVDETEPYFIEYKAENHLKTNGNQIICPQFRENEYWVDRFNPFDPIIHKTESREFLVKLLELRNSSIDLVFIKSQTEEEVEPHRGNDFAHSSYHPIGSHLTYSFIELINKNYQSLDKKFSHSLMSTYSKPKKSYQHVYKAFIEASIIEDQIQSILNSPAVFRMYDDGSIIKDFMRKTQLYLDKIKRIKLDIEAKKTAANELVQAANLSYQYRMAWLVAVLAFIQVFIAAISLNVNDVAKKITDFTTFLFNIFR